MFKFSRSPRLDNHLSESIHTWDHTRVSFHSMTLDHRVHAGDEG